MSAGASRPQQNVYVVNSVSEWPAVPDPFVVYHQTYEPDAGLYYYDGAQYQRLTTLDDLTASQTLLGTYDIAADTLSSGGPLLDASNYPAGGYYVCITPGTFPSQPNLTGKTGAPGDWIIVTDSLVWELLTFSAAFLSSEVDDIAQGVITFNQPAKGSLPADSATDYIRKQESDAADSDLQGQITSHVNNTANPHATTHLLLPDRGAYDHAEIDSHINTSDIHFDDAPADGEVYGRGNNAWVRLPTDFAAMFGPPSNRTVGTGKTVLNNWPNNFTRGEMAANPSTGVITIQAAGVYSITGYIYGTQGNDTKEEDMFLGLRVANAGAGNDGDYDLWNFMIATDKTQYRSFMFSLTRNFSTAGAQLSLYMYATAGTGTFGFEMGTFEVNELLGA